MQGRGEVTRYGRPARRRNRADHLPGPVNGDLALSARGPSGSASGGNAYRLHPARRLWCGGAVQGRDDAAGRVLVGPGGESVGEDDGDARAVRCRERRCRSHPIAGQVRATANLYHENLALKRKLGNGRRLAACLSACLPPPQSPTTFERTAEHRDPYTMVRDEVVRHRERSPVLPPRGRGKHAAPRSPRRPLRTSHRLARRSGARLRAEAWRATVRPLSPAPLRVTGMRHRCR
ncbi:hypothetical protein FB157_10434 [Streptomyces sp. BK340]|nr:hypothetical protein FB157_10434 [Streptomyces sp. BK340]